jgi:hypothetical protein
MHLIGTGVSSSIVVGNAVLVGCHAQPGSCFVSLLVTVRAGTAFFVVTFQQHCFDFKLI